jgi:hypothetical protein
MIGFRAKITATSVHCSQNNRNDQINLIKPLQNAMTPLPNRAVAVKIPANL